MPQDGTPCLGVKTGSRPDLAHPRRQLQNNPLFRPDAIFADHRSFQALHRAAAAIDERNAVVRNVPISPLIGKATRLGLAEEALIHAYDHYGQMVVYLRMNGIVPPASR
jgi:hypothetical protein